jgi:hypothetical protein
MQTLSARLATLPTEPLNFPRLLLWNGNIRSFETNVNCGRSSRMQESYCAMHKARMAETRNPTRRYRTAYNLKVARDPETQMDQSGVGRQHLART